jgi:anaerobic selenocysteine-containing dehydrogenase
VSELPAPVPEANTHCPYCALQCGTQLHGDSEVGVKVRPADFPVNRGRLCQKGWTATAVLNTADRLTRPLVRGADGRLKEASWDAALDTVAEGLHRIRGRHGPDAVAVFGGGGLTNEKAYLLGKFARLALGTSQIDYHGRFCMSSAAAAGNAAFGLDRGLPFPVTDLGNAQTVLLAGANGAETMPPLMQPWRGRPGGSGPGWPGWAARRRRSPPCPGRGTGRPRRVRRAEVPTRHLRRDGVRDDRDLTAPARRGTAAPAARGPPRRGAGRSPAARCRSSRGWLAG